MSKDTMTQFRAGSQEQAWIDAIMKMLRAQWRAAQILKEPTKTDAIRYALSQAAVTKTTK